MRCSISLAACVVLLSWQILARLDGNDPFSGLVAHAQAPCRLRGSCNLEPGLQGRSDLLMFEDFERSTWQSAWSEIDFQQNLSAVSSPVLRGAEGSRCGYRRVSTTVRRSA
jgi:hypothetical protein